ncbi:hypothetical protein RI367_008522, partial [Sorochytrium milnesiophthora]
MVNVYWPTGQPDDRHEHILAEVQRWVADARVRGDAIVLAGDLNGAVDPGIDRHNHTSSEPETSLLRWLTTSDLSDAFRQLYPELPGYTFAKVSWIDYIWCLGRMRDRLRGCRLLDVRQEISTDHRAVVATFDVQDLFDHDLANEIHQALQRAARRVMDRRSVTSVTWEQYKLDVAARMGACAELVNESYDAPEAIVAVDRRQERLNDMWSSIVPVLDGAAAAALPFRIIDPSRTKMA